MTPSAPHYDLEPYHLGAVARLEGPRLLVYRGLVEENVERMRKYLEARRPGEGFDVLRSHAKTHKASWAARLLLRHGIRKAKATPQEFAMLVESGVRDIMIAYPLLARDAREAAATVRSQAAGGIRVYAQVSHPDHIEILAAAARAEDVELDCLIDLDVGMHRTGTAPEHAGELARAIAARKPPPPLILRGLHVYDGHNHSPDESERREIARDTARTTARTLQRIEPYVRDPLVVAGGSPTFLLLLEELARVRLDARIEVSPGTWIYWDTNYDGILPGMFRIACVLLAQVIDLPGSRRITLNAGYKRWGADQGPPERFSDPALRFLQASEEHTVLENTGKRSYRIGDGVLVFPRHICSTVNLWEKFTVLGPQGEVEAEGVPVDARNR